MTTDETASFYNGVAVVCLQERKAESGSKPLFVLIELFQTPIKNILVEIIVVCKDFSIKSV